MSGYGVPYLDRVRLLTHWSSYVDALEWALRRTGVNILIIINDDPQKKEKASAHAEAPFNLVI